MSAPTVNPFALPSRKCPLVARATVRTVTGQTESFLVEWKGRAAEFGDGLDESYVAMKAERLREKLKVARVVVILHPTYDAFDLTGGRVVADTAAEGAK